MPPSAAQKIITHIPSLAQFSSYKVRQKNEDSNQRRHERRDQHRPGSHILYDAHVRMHVRFHNVQNAFNDGVNKLQRQHPTNDEQEKCPFRREQREPESTDEHAYRDAALDLKIPLTDQSERNTAHGMLHAFPKCSYLHMTPCLSEGDEYLSSTGKYSGLLP